MHHLYTRFDKLRKNTLPPQRRMDAAADLPTKVRNFLKDHKTYTTIFPHSRLAGSYAQKMCVTDVKDVDFLVFIPGTPEGEKMTLPRTAISELAAALEGLAEYLGKTKDCIEVETARRSVHVYFADEDFHLDVVPCILVGGTDEALRVPCKFEKKWVKSHPLGYIAKLDEVNSKHGYNVKRVGRMLKHFVQFKMAKRNRPKSYWLGTLLLRTVEERGFDTSKSQAQLFNWLIKDIYNRYLVTLNTTNATPNLKDPILGHNVSWNWKRSAFETFMRRLEEAIEWSDKALSEKVTKEEAVKLWQKIFGEVYFPTDIEEEVQKAAAMATPGRSAVTPTGCVVPVFSGLVAAAPAAVISRPTSFHCGILQQQRCLVTPLNLGKQQLMMGHHFPAFTYRQEGTTGVWKGQFQPRPGSPVYTVSIRFRPRMAPEVKVLTPQISPWAPHVYEGGFLCLYWPKELNFNSSMFLAETIVPWIAQWLLYYELWQETDNWLGPESLHRYQVMEKKAA